MSIISIIVGMASLVTTSMIGVSSYGFVGSMIGCVATVLGIISLNFSKIQKKLGFIGMAFGLMSIIGGIALTLIYLYRASHGLL
jgi:hypothetical protein